MKERSISGFRKLNIQLELKAFISLVYFKSWVVSILQNIIIHMRIPSTSSDRPKSLASLLHMGFIDFCFFPFSINFPRASAKMAHEVLMEHKIV